MSNCTQVIQVGQIWRYKGASEFFRKHGEDCKWTVERFTPENGGAGVHFRGNDKKSTLVWYWMSSPDGLLETWEPWEAWVAEPKYKMIEVQENGLRFHRLMEVL